MDRHELVDGDRCHRNIIGYNMKKGLRDGCLTCEGDDKIKLNKMTMDGEPVDATYLRTSGEIPDWYRRRGIVGTLPTQFSCDERYKKPLPHHDSDKSRFVVDISETDLPPDATIAYWAAKPSDEVRVAEDAYGNFDNGGITQCEGSICEFRLDLPGRYTSEGKVFKRHIHLTHWNVDRWDLDAKTIDIE